MVDILVEIKVVKLSSRYSSCVESSGYQKVRCVFFVGGHQLYVGYYGIVAVKATVPHIYNIY